MKYKDITSYTLPGQFSAWSPQRRPSFSGLLVEFPSARTQWRITRPSSSKQNQNKHETKTKDSIKVSTIYENNKPVAPISKLFSCSMEGAPRPACLIFQAQDSRQNFQASITFWASVVAQTLKNLPTMWETWVQSLSLGRSSGERNGNPLQYSCLEDAMGRGAQQSTVHGFTKRWTQLSITHTHTHTHTLVLASAKKVEISLSVYPSLIWLGIQCFRQNQGIYCILYLAGWFDNVLKWNR